MLLRLKGSSMNKQLFTLSLVTGFVVFNVLSEAPSYDDATKVAKLKEYQGEMRRFTDFLIDLYYSN